MHTCLAQSPVPSTFASLSIEDGLTSNAITALLEDQDGFLWIGTLDGLNRYDGYSIETYRAEDVIDHRLSDNFINTLFEDRAGFIWIGHQLGVDLYNPVTATLQPVKLEGASADGTNSFNALAIEEAHGAIWVGTAQGLLRIDLVSHAVLLYKHDALQPFTLNHDVITALEVDTSGTLWVATAAGLSTYDEQNDRFVHYDAPDQELLNNGTIRSLFLDSAGVMWLGGPGFLGKWNSNSESFDAYDLKNNNRNVEVISITADSPQTLWLGTSDSGLFLFHKADKSWIQVKHSDNKLNSLANNTVTSSLISRSGVRWIGTWNGLNYIKPEQPFKTQLEGRINAIHVDTDPDILWVGTIASGLFRLHTKTGEQEQFINNPGDSSSLGDNDIWAIEIGAEGDVWLATGGGGLNKFSPSTRTFERFMTDPTQPGSIRGNLLYSVLDDHQGQLWVGTAGAGLNVLEKSTSVFTHYPHVPADSQSLGYYSVWPLFKDKKSRMWLGTVGGGLDLFDATTNTFKHFRHDPDDPLSISSNRVLTIEDDSDGRLWLGTMGGGLNLFDEQENQFIHYTNQDGLAHDNIVCILSGRDNTLWIATLNGLTYFNPASDNRFVNFYETDGLPSNTFQTNACHKGPDGRFYFGTAHGLLSFLPSEIIPRSPPTVRLTAFELFNEPVLLDSSITHKKFIELPYDKNFVAFRYSAFDFANAENSVYSYQLEGLDKDWVFANDQRYISYPNLTPGQYIFRVKATNGNRVWGLEEASVQLVITSPPWKTPWAYTLYVLSGILLLMALAFSFTRWQRQKFERDNLLQHANRLAQLDKDKTRFFANISHEFRTPLSLIIGPLLTIIEDKAPLSKVALQSHLQIMLRNSERLLRLINQILDLTRLEANYLKIKASSQDLNAFIQNTILAFSPLADTYKLRLSSSLPDTPCFVYFDEEYMEHVVSNLLSNAMKFTPSGGRVHVTLKEEPSTVVLQIEDTGCGIPTEELGHIFKRFYQIDNTSTRKRDGAGIGLALAKEIVELHAGQISVTSEVGSGSKLTVRLLKGKDHLSPDQIIERVILDSPLDHSNLVITHQLSQERVFDIIPQTAHINNKDTEYSEDTTRVLIVEDNAEMRSLLRSILAPSYHVIEADNGCTGLEKARHELPDLIVADVMMDKMNGLELCKELKKDTMTSCIPVLIHTARASEKDILEGLRREADDYVIKPASPAIIRARVHNLIKQRRRLREQFNAGLFPVKKPNYPAESRVLKKIRAVMQENLSDPAFNIESLAKQCNMSYSAVYDHIKKEFNKPPSELLRTMRLESAAELLRNEKGNVSEIAYAVGFESLSYFGKRFREHFGMTPSNYLHSQ